MTRQLLVTIVAVSIAFAIGWWGRDLLRGHHTSGGSIAMDGTSACPGGATPLYWKAPMDPTYVRQQPGKSPMGMDLVPECPSGETTAREGVVEIDPQTVQNIGVRTATVTRRDLSRTIRAVGRVAYDERRVAHVHTKVQGWVEALHVDFVGQDVRKGQPLLEIYSPELVATQEELLLAARYRSSTSESPFDDVRTGGASLFEATKRRLELWDISKRDIDRLLATGRIRKTLTLRAPTSGIITELGVRAGMEVGPNQNLYTIADLSAVWVEADVYEYELPWLALGQTGTVELSYLSGRRISGPLTYIAPFLDPTTRTAAVRLELPNADGALRPEMFGNVLIEGTPQPGVIAVPAEAVIRSGRRTLVIVALENGRFAPRNVRLGMDSGDGWLEVVEGIADGEEIVLSSQFLIDSESNLQVAVQKLLANQPGSEAEVPPAEAGLEETSGHEHPTDGDAPMDPPSPGHHHHHGS